MVSFSLLLLFVGALALVYALPGPDMALMLQTSISRGVRQGLATGLGLAIARATHVLLSACGLAALLHSAPWLYDTVRVAGGLYLAYLAIQILRAPGLHFETAAPTAPALRAAVMKGLLSNLLNPKALLFCSVLLPQFITPAAGPVWLQVLELGVMLVAVGMLFDLALAFGASGISNWLRRHPRAQAVQRWTFATVLLAFAARLSVG